MSTRALHRRLRRLEERPGGVHGPCPDCGGRGRLVLVNEHEGETVETAQGCTGCGKVGKIILLQLAEDPHRG